MNGVSYTNKVSPIYNGRIAANGTYEYTPVPINNDLSVGYATAKMFNGATNGVQLPPNLD